MDNVIKFETLTSRFYRYADQVMRSEMYRNRAMQLGLVESSIKQDLQQQTLHIVQAVSSLNYSNNMMTSVRSASMRAAEWIMRDPIIDFLDPHWDLKDVGHIMTIAKRGQSICAAAFSIDELFHGIHRQTTVDVFNEETMQSYAGEMSITSAYYCTSSMLVTDRSLQDTVAVNRNSSSSAKNKVKFLSAILHEETHAAEEILHRKNTLGDLMRPSEHSDAELASAQMSLSRNGLVRTVNRDIYRQLPSERLARIAQSTFEKRVVAGFLEHKFKIA